MIDPPSRQIEPETQSAPSDLSSGQSMFSLILFCGLLMTLSGYSTDVMLPAFAVMVDDLNTSLDHVQATVSVFALFFGIGQFFYGPASDRFGRRPVITIGLIIFLSGAGLATLGTTIETVLSGRALQGLGAGAAPVLARAILRDTHSGNKLARALALCMAIFALGPIFAPLVGYAGVELFGWRSTFASTGVLAFTLLLFNHFRFKETNDYKDKEAINPGRLLSSSRKILSNTQTLYFLICGSLGYCALFSYISNAPRIYATSFGVNKLEFAIFFAATGLGIILGQTANRALLPRLGVLVMLRIASIILLLASAGCWLFSNVDGFSAWHFTVLMFGFNTSFLVVVSNTASLCLNPHPTLAGLASAVYGCVTNASGAIFIATTVSIVGLSLFHWAAAMTLVTALCAILIWIAPKEGLDFDTA